MAVVGLLVGGLVVVPSAERSRAANLTVDSGADGADVDAGDGVCATAADVCTLRAAVMEASALPGDDVIGFAPSVDAVILTIATPGGAVDSPADGDLDVSGPDDLTIAGTPTISAAGLGDRVLDVSGDGDLTLDGLTIAGGTAPGAEAGGGVRFLGTGALTVEDAVIRDNLASTGGGLWVGAEAITTTLIDVTVSGNAAVGGGPSSDGGGVHVSGPAILTDVMLTDNRADGDGGGLSVGIGQGVASVALGGLTVSRNTAGHEGGGIWIGQVNSGASVTATLTGSTVDGNTAAATGGGVFLLHGDLLVERTAVTNNQAGTPSAGGGGGIAAQGDELTVRESTVEGNQASFAAGLLLQNTTTLIERSTIAGNVGLGGDAPGGVVICCFDSTAAFVNSTISGNAGAGIDATADGPVTLNHVTVTDNSGAVVWSPFAPSATFTVHASIVDGSCTGDLATEGGNVVTNSACADGPEDATADPQLGPLTTDNGGPTATHEPADTSPAVNLVDPPCPGTDQRLVPRPAGPSCDAGAVEVVAIVPMADLAITLDDTDPVAAGQPVTYTMTATNLGPDPASGVALSLRLPPQTAFASADAGCTHVAGEVTCAVGDLAAGASATRTVTATTSSAGGTLTAAAQVTATSPADPVPESNAETETTTVVDVPAMSIDDTTAVEGTSATATPVSVTATLSAPAVETVTVEWATVDGSATAPADYVAASGTLTFRPGETTATADVSIVADDVVEPDESFSVQLSDPQGATIADASATVTIVDDDVPALAVSDETVVEPDTGTVDATFEITLDEPPVEPVSVQAATVAGTAAAGSDFVATSATVTFAPGEQVQSFDVPVVGDILPEPTEELFVTLSDPVGATVADGQGTGTITDTDVPGFTIDDASVTEGDSGLARLTFTVRRGSGTGVAWVTATTGDGTATQPADYLARTATLRFPAGVTERTFNVSVVGDLLAEPDETFVVRLSSPLGAPILDAEATGTIVDDGDVCTQVGTAGADVLLGGPGDDVLCGLGGDDELYGEAGADELLGGPGHDALYGGGHDDTLAGDAGDDELNGDDGADVLGGGSGNDALRGGSGDDMLIGGLNADQLEGGDGADTLHGDDGGDPEATAGGFDWLSGGAGDDTLHGQAGNDRTLEGGAGIDRIHGGMGNDNITGGPEAGNMLVGGSGDSDRCATGPSPGNVRDVSCERPQPGTVVVAPWWTG